MQSPSQMGVVYPNIGFPFPFTATPKPSRTQPTADLQTCHLYLLFRVNIHFCGQPTCPLPPKKQRKREEPPKIDMRLATYPLDEVQFAIRGVHSWTPTTSRPRFRGRRGPGCRATGGAGRRELRTAGRWWPPASWARARLGG